MPDLASALKPFESQIVASAVAELTDNKAEVIAELVKLERPAIDSIVDHIVGLLPQHGLLAMLDGPLATAIKAYEPQIIASLGGENEALFALLIHEVQTLKLDGLV